VRLLRKSLRRCAPLYCGALKRLIARCFLHPRDLFNSLPVCWFFSPIVHSRIWQPLYNQEGEPTLGSPGWCSCQRRSPRCCSVTPSARNCFDLPGPAISSKGSTRRRLSSLPATCAAALGDMMGYAGGDDSCQPCHAAAMAPTAVGVNNLAWCGPVEESPTGGDSRAIPGPGLPAYRDSPPELRRFAGIRSKGPAESGIMLSRGAHPGMVGVRAEEVST
jgi:hypothetical protein